MHRGLLIVVMDHPEDAQRHLEQRALRNVRALIDKLQAGNGSGAQGVLAVGIVVTCVLAMLGLAMLVNPRQPPPVPMVVEAPPIVAPPDSRPNPRRGSVQAARGTRFEPYLNAYTEKVERAYRLNYPSGVKGVSGSLVLSTAIKSDGAIDRIEILRGSGHPALDSAAERVVRLAAPFPQFPADIAEDTDLLLITRTFRFTKEKKSSAPE